MSKWDDFKKSFGEFADKAAAKTRELSDTASLKIKIANKEAQRDTEYKVLGKLAYTKLKNLEVEDPEALTARLSETLEKLDVINAELAELKAEDEARKAAREAEKMAREAKKAQEQNDDEPDEELNTAVMTEFNEARKHADTEYDKAKKAAEDAAEQ